MTDHKFYVVTPIFNPINFRSRTKLYRQFAKHMRESGAILFTVEAAFGDHHFEVTTPEDPFNLQLRTDQVLWHKERMIKLGIQSLRHLVPGVKYVGWFDADITFSNADWAEETIHKLMHHPVVQPFGAAVNLDADEQPMWTCPSSFRAFIEGRGYHQTPPVPIERTYKGHPGLAWAARVDALDALGGVYDLCLAGSGDSVMSNALKGKWDAFLPAAVSDGMAVSIKRWAARCDRFVRGNVGYVRGSCMHHWHGNSSDRGYEKRWSIMAYHDFDPAEDVVVDSQGLFRWAGNKPSLEQDMRLSLSSRDEDSAAKAPAVARVDVAAAGGQS